MKKPPSPERGWRRFGVESLETRRLLAAGGDALADETALVAEAAAAPALSYSDADNYANISVETQLLSVWDHGATVSIIVRNLGDVAIDNWTIRWEPLDSQLPNYTWDAQFDISTATIVAMPMDANRTIGSGQAVAFGFNVDTGTQGWLEPNFEFAGSAGGSTLVPDAHPSEDPSDNPPSTEPPDPGETESPIDDNPEAPTVAAGLSVSMSIDSQWSGGFTAHVKIANPSLEAVTLDEVVWSWPSDYAIDLAWNAAVSRSGPGQFTAKPEEGFRVVAPGQAIAFGFNASYDGQVPLVPQFVVTQVGGSTTTDAPANDAPQNPGDDSEETSTRLPLNYIVGTQTIGPGYSLTGENTLVETAKAIQAMGSNILKIALDPTLYGMSSLNQWQPVELLQNNPAFAEVLGMEFDYYFFWLERSGPWADNNGISSEEYEAEYRVTYDLATYLLQTFADSGKTFFIGNWETDWNLLEWDASRQVVDNTRVQGLIDWLNLRQQAIDDAKAAFTGQGVDVFHYVEVNRVEDAQQLGYQRVVNSVLPFTNVDFVSYSAYDLLLDASLIGSYDEALADNLSYINDQLPAKEGLPFDKRVFIGEFGFYLTYVTPEQQLHLTVDTVKAAIRWGTPFVLNWQIYDTAANEQLYLIDSDGEPTLVYELFANYETQMNDWAIEFVQLQGREPTEAEIREESLLLLERLEPLV